ncbi:hypothetical protein ABZ502_28505 [Streptomyces abikoensis]|uniref:hypothetical protein n=1 Tax=Streptomyces abikoensis TaxID=97398 RepID=UPI00340BB67E
MKCVELICAGCGELWMFERPRGKGGRNPATNPMHPECKQKRDNQNRAVSRDRKRQGLPPKKQPDRADALDIAWRAGSYVEEVLQFEAPPGDFWHREAEERIHMDVRFSTVDDRRAVARWFLDTREPKGGPEAGRTTKHRSLAVIGSARPWWDSEAICTRGRIEPMKPFTIGA